MVEPAEGAVIGWDIGGAHVKACVVERSRVVDVAQWACPLWQGLGHLERALDQAMAHWPGQAQALHAVTMTGEMTDLFRDRRDGVQRISATMATSLSATLDAASAEALRARLHFFAGPGTWCGLAEVADAWDRIASANWLATASHVAGHFANTNGPVNAGGVLIDIGSTTTDFIAFRAGRLLSTSRTDAERLASGELTYHGVARTPLCAFARRIAFRGVTHNVMNEFFATAADVYRLTGELDPAHDLHPAADAADKSLDCTRRRLARMIGMDAHDAASDEWRAFAEAWRAAQVAELGGQLHRVLKRHALDATPLVVTAGCGDFLAADVQAEAARLAGLAPPSRAGSSAHPGPGGDRLRSYGADVVRVSTRAADALAVAAWAQVCAPSVAVACLLDAERR